jgi:hypothetical protein
MALSAPGSATSDILNALFAPVLRPQKARLCFYGHQLCPPGQKRGSEEVAGAAGSTLISKTVECVE